MCSIKYSIAITITITLNATKQLLTSTGTLLSEAVDVFNRLSFFATWLPVIILDRINHSYDIPGEILHVPHSGGSTFWHLLLNIRFPNSNVL